MSVAHSEVDDFMQSINPVEQTPPVEQSAPTETEAASQPPIQEQQGAPVVDTSGAEAEAGQATEPQAPATPKGPTPEQEEITRLRAENERLRGDHELADFEAGLKRAADSYTANRQRSIDTAHRRNRELIDAGEPEKADQELRAFYENMAQADNSMRQYVQNQRQEFVQKRQHVDLAPRYAQHLGEKHKLSAEDIELLSQFEGPMQDRLIPGIVARSKAAKQTAARIRDLEAASRSQSGAFTPGGTTGSAAPTQSQRPTDPMQAEVWDFMQSPIVPVGGR